MEPASRVRSIVPALLFLALGGFMAFVAWDGIAELTSGVAAHALQLVVRTGAAAAIPAAIMLVLLAVMLVWPAQARRLFAVVLVCTPLLLLFPVAFYVGTNRILPGRGYERCADPETGSRYLAVRWVRAGGCAGSARVLSFHGLTRPVGSGAPSSRRMLTMRTGRAII